MRELNTYIGPLITATIISVVATSYIKRWALKKKIALPVRPRDIHKIPVPRLGGLAIAATFWLTVLIMLVVAPERLNFLASKDNSFDTNLLGIVIGAAIIIGAMVYDDLKGLAWRWKLLAQFLAAVAVAVSGITIHWFSNPFGDRIFLSGEIVQFGSIAITWGQVFVALWIMGVVNIVNWLDGMDGLAGGISIIAATTLFLLAIGPAVNQPATALLAIILVGSILGFMPFNISRARIFLGDTGSMFIGYMLAVLAIISGGKVATASLVLGIPIIDAVWVIAYRLWHRRSPFIADKNHLHHRLLAAGLKPRHVLTVYYLLCVLFGYLALRSGTEGKFIAGLWLVGVTIAIIIGTIVLEWKRRAKEG